ncbi:MAG: hypothetical protein HKP61_14365, partial [Dactylosporangium sp.]|nr:hypothetical protein [Dactylosporangium sp.]NNJ62095.1 hypothetical protein [Dactylosporangium sp.]
SCAAARPGGVPSGSTAVNLAAGTAEVRLGAGETTTCTYAFDPPAMRRGLSLQVFSEGGGGRMGIAVAGAGGSWSLAAAPAGDGGAAVATGADLAAPGPGTYTVTITPPPAEGGGEDWRLDGAECAGAPLSPRNFTITVPVTAGATVECVLRVVLPPAGLGLRLATMGGRASAAFSVAAVDGPGTGWSAGATTAVPGRAVDAGGEGLGSLAAGAYLITPIAPRVTERGGWRLATFDCTDSEPRQLAAMAPDQDGERVPGPLVVTLRPGAPAVVCAVNWQFIQATRLRITLRVDGPPTNLDSPGVVEVRCVDGSAGRVVLSPTGDILEASLVSPLSFLAETQCTITHPATGLADTIQVVTMARVEPAAGNVPLLLPLTVDIRRDVEDYTVTIVELIEAPSESPTPHPVFKTFRSLPYVLAGAGLVGLGALLLLLLVARWRRGEDD